MSPPNIGAMTKAANGSPPVTIQNMVFEAKRGNGTFFSNNFVFAGFGLMNYLSIPAVQERVSDCVLHDNGAGLAYAISDNPGGCE